MLNAIDRGLRPANGAAAAAGWSRRGKGDLSPGFSSTHVYSLVFEKSRWRGCGRTARLIADALPPGGNRSEQGAPAPEPSLPECGTPQFSDTVESVPIA